MPAMRMYRICLHDARHQPTILEIVRREAARPDASQRQERVVSMPHRRGAFA
jgi:hypothetical protein